MLISNLIGDRVRVTMGLSNEAITASLNDDAPAQRHTTPDDYVRDHLGEYGVIRAIFTNPNGTIRAIVQLEDEEEAMLDSYLTNLVISPPVWGSAASRTIK